MSRECVIKGSWSNNDDKIVVKLQMIEFEENGVTIIYCPALDLSGYGNNSKEAEESFNISLSEFFLYTLHKGTFYNEFKRLGWKVHEKKKSKPMTPPSMESLLRENANFSRVFENYDFRKFKKGISIPA